MSFDSVARSLAHQAREDAASAARTANTQVLARAARDYGFFPAGQALAPAADLPALSLGGANAASAINGRAAGNPLVLASDNRIAWLSGPTVQDGSGAWKPRGAWYGLGRDTQFAAVEFVHTGTEFEIAVLGSFYAASGNIRILVNERIVGLASVPYSTGSWYYLRATFPAPATRRVRIEGANGKVRGINVAATDELSATGRTYPLITVMGDSLAEGTGAAQPQDGQAVALVRALGGNIALGAVGGTGLLNPGSGGKVAWTDPVRLTDLTMAGVSNALGASTLPALGIVMMSFNDQGLGSALWSPHGSSFQAAINNRVHALINGWVSANPGRPLVFLGPTWPSGEPVLDVYRIRDACQEACWYHTRSNVWFIDRLGPQAMLRAGANSYASTTGTTTSGSTSVTGIPGTSGLVIGAGVEGPGIAPGTSVTAIDSATAITLNCPASASGTTVALVFRNTQAALYGYGPADGTHPGTPGHTLDALWMARQLRALIFTELA